MLLLKDGLMYWERPDLGTFDEGFFESLFVEIVTGGGCRNDVVGMYIGHQGEIGGGLMLSWPRCTHFYGEPTPILWATSTLTL